MCKDPWIILLLGLAFPSVLTDQCILTNPAPNKQQLLKKISLLTGKKFVAEEGEFSYAVAICSNVSKADHVFASVTRTKINKTNSTVVLGRYNDTDLVGGDQWILLKYSSGEVMKDTHCKNTSWSTQILFTCDIKFDDLNIELLDSSFSGCMSMFHLKTSILCPATGMSKTSIFFLLLLISGVSYLVVGVLYKRFVAGAKGWEQIPNYEFWRDPCLCVKDFVRRGQVGREERWDNLTNNFSDPADEPLLHP